MTKRNSGRHFKTVCTHSGEGKSRLISVIKRTRAAVSSAGILSLRQTLLIKHCRGFPSFCR